MPKPLIGRKVKRNLTLALETDDVISRAGNASRYVEALVVDARAAWRDALDYLTRDAGLDRAQVRRLASDIDARPAHPWRGAPSPVQAATAALVLEWRRGNEELRRALEEPAAAPPPPASKGRALRHG